MPDISFYLLSSTSAQERYLFACKLIEKAYRSGVACYVLTDRAEQSQLLDNLLWTFRAGSFIPHQIYNGQIPDAPLVTLIGHQPAPAAWRHTLINLSTHCPEAFLHLQRLLEILDQNEETKAAGRQRYRQYQQAGISIATHNL
ncbi:DNA polymerase III subunit chi [Methylovulum psychrotolerans]|uniref:DNA polymerase III subunit chi n=1 Tax=Methylovulum psychrotolerans TaxID=1704499 RepID=A0A1Z4BW72_9GAMM|nr:DNA polymerase III subunit chi [Methylovulum psychrotolerans]ASF45535.1 DNA polymerase III subunit chi [Methylovulum psychrotolerans]POZ52928.1 DNA polymerase III subunit chi [Methylovulum psychrotolerans]